MSYTALILATALLTVGDEGAFTATALDGTTASGRLTQMTTARIELTSDNGDATSWAIDDLLEVRRATGERTANTGAEPLESSEPPDADAAPVVIELIDGTRLSADRLTIADRVVAFPPRALADNVELPTDRVRRIEFLSDSSASDELSAIEKAWQSLSGKNLVGDVLLVKQRDGQSIDYLTGVVGDVDQQQLVFQWDGDSIPVKRTKVAGIAFYHPAARQLDPLACRLQLDGGDRINCSHAELVGDSVEMVTQAGVVLRAPIDAILQFDFSAGKVAFLDEMQPAVERWTPQLEIPDGADLIAEYGLPRRNRSYLGGALSLHWPSGSGDGAGEVRTYQRGLALRSRTVLEYRLEPGMRRFQAVAGIDPACTDQGAATLEIYADDRLLWRGEINGGEAPAEIDLPLPECRRLRLVCDYGDNLDFGDRVHLVGAKVTK